MRRCAATVEQYNPGLRTSSDHSTPVLVLAGDTQCRRFSASAGRFQPEIPETTLAVVRTAHGLALAVTAVPAAGGVAGRHRNQETPCCRDHRPAGCQAGAETGTGYFVVSWPHPTARDPRVPPGPLAVRRGIHLAGRHPARRTRPATRHRLHHHHRAPHGGRTGPTARAEGDADPPSENTQGPSRVVHVPPLCTRAGHAGPRRPYGTRSTLTGSW